MSGVTRSSLRTRCLQLADAVSSPRWDSSTTGASGEVDQHLGVVHAREWRRLLNANSYLRVSKRTPTVDSSGRVLISDLSSGTGDSAERFYRVLTLAANDRPYKEITSRDGFMAANALTASASVPTYAVWFRQGDYLIVPDAASTTLTAVWVNHLPTRADNLATDASIVQFPDDYEDVIAYEVASILLSKGAAEMDASAVLKALAEDLRRDLLQDVVRNSNAPLVMQYPDTPQEWAG